MNIIVNTLVALAFFALGVIFVVRPDLVDRLSEANVITAQWWERKGIHSAMRALPGQRRAFRVITPGFCFLIAIMALVAAFFG